MSTSKEVAEWMYQELMQSGQLYQQHAIAVIAEQFGTEFIRSGKAIEWHVLAEFRKLTKGTAVWEYGKQRWRRLI